ncbi:MAG: serpin family protein [Thermoguttaceae bacterium]|jgi:serpin B
MSTKIISVIVLAVAAAVVSIVPAATASDAAEPAVQTEAVVQGNNAFALGLYAKLRTENKGSLFCSPYSVSTALAMAYAGAKGKTAAEMADVLHFTVPQEELPRAFAALAARLHGDVKKVGYQLSVANRLWGQTGYHFLPAFLQVTRDDFAAELAQLDFEQNADAARRTINAWVEEKTERKIKDLIAPGVLGPATTLVLTNAIYFKGDWQMKFEVRATRDAPFSLAPQEKVTVPMMQQQAMFAYGAADDLRILELPYVGRNLSMFVLLPTELDGLAGIEQKLSVETLKTWTSGLTMQTVEVFLPKFRISSGFRLDKTLETMGISQAFSRSADFSGMTGKRDIFFSAVIHKAFVDVKERGTEAAAATGIMMARAAPRPQQPIPVFRADHPFLFLIRDNRTGSILFLGRIVNPKG